MTAIDLDPEERAFLTWLITGHNMQSEPGHENHRLLLRKLKLTLEEWENPNREILT